MTFPLAPIYARKGIRFINEAAETIDPAAHTVTTSSGEELAYDRLFIGTGPRLAFEKVPGLGPHDGHTQSVCNLEHALLARDEWDRFLQNPGPVVIGTAQGGSCFGASYEFMFNAHHQIKKAGLQDVAPVTFITAEPFLGHFGLGGVGNSEQMINRFFDKLGIEGRPNTVIKEARDGEIELDDGTVLPAAYSMIVPPFTGVDAVRNTEGLGNPMGFIPVDEQFRHTEFPDIFAAGVAIAIAPPAADAGPGRRAEDRADDRDDGEGRGAQHRRRHRRLRPAPAPDRRPRRDVHPRRRQQRRDLQGQPRPRPPTARTSTRT